MIFRNDLETIDATLKSYLPWVDEAILTDTGSTDGTRDLVSSRLEEWGLPFKILDFKWKDDFSSARQVGFDAATSNWILWCDADDILEGGEQLQTLTQAAPETGAFIFDYDYGQAPTGECICLLHRERLLRRSVGWVWASPVHEVCLPQSPCQFVKHPGVIYHHRKVGNPDEGDRNLRIIERHLAVRRKAKQEPDPRMVVYHGIELAHRGKFEEAIEAYKWYMQLSGWGEEKHQAIHRMADAYRAMGAFEEAMQCETYAMTHASDHEQPEWADHHLGVGESLMLMERWAHAIPWLRRGLELGMPQSSMILNPRDYDFGPHFNLSICHARLGDFDHAMGHALEARKIIPEDASLLQNMAMIERDRTKEQVVRSSLALLEGLIRYDENLKAREILPHLPYVAKEDQRVQQLAYHIRSATFQIGSKKGYERMYATNREVRNPDDFVENASDMFSRVEVLAEELTKMKEELGRVPRLLDAGCNDGWVGAHLEKRGLCIADGIDLNPEAIAAALDRKKRFKLKGQYEIGFVEDAGQVFGHRQYDVICCYEVFEHLQDPEDSIGALELALKPGGRMFLSTPDGAFEKGLIPNWQENLAKQHLRAVTPTEFTRFAMERGDLRGYVSGREGVQVLHYIPAAHYKKHVVLYLGQGWEPWSPRDIQDKGLGGSETAAVKMATHLADQGHFVEVYASLSESGPIDGVLYRDHGQFEPGSYSDVFISSRNAQIFGLRPAADFKVLWCHDAHVGGGLADYIDEIDEVWCVSADHEAHLRQVENLLDEEHDAKFNHTRNGIDLSLYKDGARRFHSRQPTVIYSSSADRGLETLLDVWPQIVKLVPKAKLRVFYGFDVFDRMHGGNPGMMVWKDGLLRKARALKGVTMEGRVSHAELAAAQQRARVWAYPYAKDNPTETSCITAMECMAAGMVAVTTRTAALPETLGAVGLLIDGDPFEERYQVKFVGHVIEALTNPGLFLEQSTMGQARAQGMSWDAVGKEWALRIEDALTPALSIR